MTGLKVSIFAEAPWVGEIERMIYSITDLPVTIRSIERKPDLNDLGEIVLVDENTPDLISFLGKIDRKKSVLFLVTDETMLIPETYYDSLVDDVMVYPFRLSEVYSKLKGVEHMQLWQQIEHLNTSFKSVISQFTEDLELSSKIQKRKLPKRFSDLKGLKIQSRYLVGEKPGGDYFDLAEITGRKAFSIILTDSSSYGLTSAVLGVLAKTALKLGEEKSLLVTETLESIQEDLVQIIGEKNHLSVFYGIYSREDLSFQFLNLGSSRLYHSSKNGTFRWVPAQGPSISSVTPFQSKNVKVENLKLEPEDRLVLMSDGFVEAFELKEVGLLEKTLNDLRGKEAPDTLNELSFAVRSKVENWQEDIPPQDCTALVIDIDANVLRLARNT